MGRSWRSVRYPSSPRTRWTRLGRGSSSRNIAFTRRPSGSSSTAPGPWMAADLSDGARLEGEDRDFGRAIDADGHVDGSHALADEHRRVISAAYSRHNRELLGCHCTGKRQHDLTTVCAA